MPGTTDTTFNWKCSYMGCVDYEAHTPKGTIRLEVRRQAGDYERSVFNGDGARWKRDVIDLVDVLRVPHDHADMTPEFLAGFNAWLLAEHEKSMAHMRKFPERYGDIDADPSFGPPQPCRAVGRWVGGVDGAWQMVN